MYFLHEKNKSARVIYSIIAVILSLSFLLVYGRSKDMYTLSDGVKYIKWVDFNVSSEALSDAARLDIKAHEEGKNVSFSSLLAYLGAKYGGSFKGYKKSDLTYAYEKLSSDEHVFDDMKFYLYYKEAYGAVVDGMIGEYGVYEEKEGRYDYTIKYGVKAFSPFAAGYYYNDYDDFGASRTYGYARSHLGHDMLGSVGTPIIAIESGYVECVGWNQYGGWRIGIRSFDGKRYYYYAHLRRGHPYNDMYEGKIVTAGEVIGYLGMTGYSAKEDTNNINIPHLHVGLQLIFNEVQKDGSNQIWIDMYELVKFLAPYRSKVYKGDDGEYHAVNPITDFNIPD